MRHTPAKLALFATTILASTVPAMAQDGGGDIVVTARRTEERLQDVPISITVFNQDQLSDRNVVNAGDLATYTPSLSSNPNFGSENTTFAIRGFAQDIGTLPSVGTYFAEVVTPRGASNGIPTGDGVLPGNFFDLQNVQILKGPQGTLFGRNTTGGAVLLVPQKPTDKLEGYVEGSYGNYDMKRVQGAINIPLADTFKVRLGVDRMKRDGYLKNQSGIGHDRFNDTDYTAVRLSVVADLTPDLENYLIASYIHSDTNGPLTKLVAVNPNQGLGGIFAGSLAAQGSGFYNVINPLANSYSKINQWQVINNTTWRASDTLTVKNIASYAEYKQTLNAAEFGLNAVIDFNALTGGTVPIGTYNVPFTQISAPPGLKTADQYTFTDELQLQGKSLDGKLNWQVGGYAEISRPLGLAGGQSPFLASCQNGSAANFQCNDPIGFLSYLGAIGANPATPPIHVGSVNYTVGQTFFQDFGAYAQATYALTDKLKLTGGIRYTWDKQRNESVRRTYTLQYPPAYGLFPSLPGAANPRCTDPSTVANDCSLTLRQSSDKPTWLIDVDYNFTPDVLLYGKYARGYRSATIAPNVAAPLNLIGPEKVDSYELGLKTSFRGTVRGTFNLAAFYNDFSNQQLQVGFTAVPGSGQATTAAPVNAGKSEIYGLEAEATVNPFDGLQLAASYTYLHTEIKSVPDTLRNYSDPNFTLDAAFMPGDPEVLSPKHKLTASANYTLPLDESIGRISFGAIYTYRAKMLVNYIDRGNTAVSPIPGPSIASFSTLPSLSLVNLNASWDSIGGSPIDVSFFATNVTKKKYYTFAGGLGSPQTGFETASVGEPRMYGVRVKYKFGS